MTEEKCAHGTFKDEYVHELQAKLAEMTSDRDSWQQQASDRLNDANTWGRERDEARSKLARLTSAAEDVVTHPLPHSNSKSLPLRIEDLRKVVYGEPNIPMMGQFAEEAKSRPSYQAACEELSQTKLSPDTSIATKRARLSAEGYVNYDPGDQCGQCGSFPWGDDPAEKVEATKCKCPFIGYEYAHRCAGAQCFEANSPYAGVPCDCKCHSGTESKV